MYDDHAAYRKRTASLTKPFASFLALSALWCLLLLFFNRFPQLDLSIARDVFTAAPCDLTDPVGRICGMFAYDKSPLFVSLRNIMLTLPYIAIVILLCVPLISWRKFGTRWRTPKTDLSIAALISLALGCGLIVNLTLKEFSGRPRPRDTDLFGGALDFVQAGSFAGKCLRNCSFISGEASSAGWLICLVVLLPARWRLPLGIPLAAISLLIPTMRVLTGAHYLSDAVLGWLSSLVIFAATLAAFEALDTKSLRRV